jgi:HAD superfamily hydrolase (TIGR01450 family)
MQIRGFVVDLEGVLIKGSDLVPLKNSIEFINSLRSKKIPFLIATNNSVFSPHEIVKKLNNRGFELYIQDIISPVFICVEELKRLGIHRIFVLGTSNLIEILESNGFTVSNSKDSEAVIIGKLDRIDLEILIDACEILERRNSILCTMNNNRIVMDDNSRHIPGPGAFAEMLKYATNYQKEVMVFGKGSPQYNSVLFKRLRLSPDQVAIISDDIYTDIKEYQDLGLTGIFITTGKYSRKDIGKIIPSMVIDDLIELEGLLA